MPSSVGNPIRDISGSSWSRRGLILALTSVVVSAAIGITVLIGGKFGDLAIRVLQTSLSITGACLLAVPCAAVRERGSANIAAVFGLFVTAVAFSLAIPGIWLEIGAKAYWKFFAVSLSFAGALAYSNTLLLFRLQPRDEPVRAVGIAAALVLASILSFMVVAESDPDWLWRAIGVCAIVNAAVLCLAPIVQRLHPVIDDSAEVDFCPGCGRRLRSAYGTVACAACHRRYRIEAANGSR